MYCPDFAICASKVVDPAKTPAKTTTTKTAALRRKKVPNEG